MNNNEEILDSKIDDLYMVFVINNQKYALSSKYITEIIEILPTRFITISIMFYLFVEYRIFPLFSIIH